MSERVRVVVSGLVHGVSFRFFIRQNAVDLGLAGWVRNLPEGRVEAVFEGERKKIERMVSLCRKGPFRSRVDKVDVFQEQPEGIEGFGITY